MASTTARGRHRPERRRKRNGKQDTREVTLYQYWVKTWINIFRERASTHIQLVQDLCDLTIPSAALSYANLDDGIVGLAGTASSLIGVWTTWKKTA